MPVRALILFALLAFPAFATELRYAKNFRIEDKGTYRELSIRNTWAGAGEGEQRYALVPRGSELPQLEKSVVVVRTPVERAVVLDTVFLGPIQELKLHDSLVGIGLIDYVTDPIARERVASGAAKAIASGAGLEVEPLLVLKPGIIIASTTGSATFDTHPALRRAGLPVVVMADYMEENPLARTEWIKCVAAFYGKDAEAAELFDQVAERYEALKRLAAETKRRPTVMCNAPYGGIWHVPGGQSFAARFIADAGGEYVWNRLDSRGGVPLDMEVILRDAAEADVWLHPSYYATLATLTATDERLTAFKPLSDRQVYNHTLRVNAAGGNDIHERGVSHPEEVLADLIKILHPELLPGHRFVYYERLP